MSRFSTLAGVGVLMFLPGLAPAEETASQAYAMPFERCLVAIRNTAQRLDRRPMVLDDTADRKVVEFTAEDGVLRVSCHRATGQMVITRRPHGEE